MIALGLILAGQRLLEKRLHLRLLLPRRLEKARTRAATPGLESLEKIELLTHAALPASTALYGNVLSPKTTISTVTATTTPQFVQVQTATVPATLTNFTKAFSPSFNLFNPALGTLTAVHITSNTYLSSTIQSQNLSVNSTAAITGTVQGNYSIIEANPTFSPQFPVSISGNLPAYSATDTVATYNNEPDFTGNSTANFVGLSTSDSKSFDLTDPASLAYFTASAGRTTSTPELVMNGQSGASAPNGNIQTLVVTYGLGNLTVSYSYTPPTPAVVSLVRYGIHHQQTQLQLTFSGYVDPTEAQNPSNYRVIVPNRYGSFTGAGVTYVAIANATFNSTTNSVTLLPARRLNVHYQFQLQVKLPVNNGNIVVLDFGGKRSLGGFNNHQGQFVNFRARVR